MENWVICPACKGLGCADCSQNKPGFLPKAIADRLTYLLEYDKKEKAAHKKGWHCL